MKKLKKIFVTSIFVLAAALLASCSNVLEDSQKKESEQAEKIEGVQNGGVRLSLKVSLEMPSAKTVFPVYDPTVLKEIQLWGKEANAADYPKEPLKTWADFAALKRDDGVVTDSFGEKITVAYDFKLTAKSAGSSMSAEKKNVVPKEGEITSLSFALTVDAAATGKANYGTVEIPLETEIEFSKITATWDSDDESELSISSKRNDEGENYFCALFKKENVEKGSYKVTFKFYFPDADEDGIDELVYTYPTYVIVQEGAVSRALLSDDDITEIYGELYVCDVTYDFNGGTVEGSEIENFVQVYYPCSLIKGENLVDQVDSEGNVLVKLKAPSEKKFRGWNTQADGRGERYSKGNNPAFSKDTTLYAQWCDYDETEKVFTISSEDDLWAFFSYREGSEKYDNAKLLEDIPQLSDWVPNNYSGVFDGNSKMISNLSLKSGDLQYAGFIGSLNNGKIKNLTIHKATIATTHEEGNAGAFAGYAYSSSIEGCQANAVTISGKNAGGIVGYAYLYSSSNSISAPKVTGKTVITGTQNAGGVAGYFKGEGKISSASIASAEIKSVSSRANVGGVAGSNSGIIEGATFNTAKINASGAGSYVGGVAGCNNYKITGKIDIDSNTKIENTSSGAYSSHSCTGGVAGYSSGFSSSIEGTVTILGELKGSSGKTYTYLGGIVGFIDYYGNVGTSINSSINIRSKISGSGQYTGGVAGYNNGTIGGYLAQVTVFDIEGDEIVSGSGQYTGGVVGYNDTNGSIAQRISVEGAVYGSGQYTGGIAGYNKGKIGTDSVSVKKSVTGGDYTGGVAGYNAGSFSGSGSIEISAYVEGEGYTGGVAGYNAKDASIAGAKVTGLIFNEGQYTGGIAGYNDGTIGWNLYTQNAPIFESGAIVCGEGEYTGGIAGYNNGTIGTKFRANGKVYGAGRSGNSAFCYVGGVAGYNAEGASISFDTTNGTLLIKGCEVNDKFVWKEDGETETFGGYGKYLGGVAGYNAGTITSPFVTNATIKDDGKKAWYVSGVAGYNAGTISNPNVKGTTINGNTNYAYVNSIAVGLSGTVSGTTTQSGNTITGKSNVPVNAYCTISSSSTSTAGSFTTVNRSVQAKYTIITKKQNGDNGGAATPYLYKGATDVLDVAKVDTGSSKTYSLTLSSSTQYTAEVNNENIFTTHYATIRIEVE